MSTFCLFVPAPFGTFFLEVFLEQECNGKKYRCAVFGCNNHSLYLSGEKGDHYYIQKRQNDLFSHYTLILRKL